MLKFGRGDATLLDDLIEPAIEPGEGVRDAVGALVSACCGGARGCICLRDAFELPRHGVETLVDGNELLAPGVLVVVRFSI
jgi:hypothetical protein